MRVKFVGESPARSVVVPGGVIVAEFDVPVDVPDAIGKSLCEQSVWVPVKASKGAAPAAETEGE